MSLFTKAHVQQCRERWNTPQFPEMFTAFCQSCHFTDVVTRLKLDEIEGLQLVLDVIRLEKEELLMSRAWIILQNFVLVHIVDDPNEMKPIDIFVERGGVELAAMELSRPQPRWVQVILTALAWTSTNERAVPRVIAAGVHKVGISYVRENHPMLLDISMSFIRSASAAPSCRSTLRADGALEAFLQFIECNKSTEPLQMRRGFRAASVVARLAGQDETGLGPTVLKNNPELINTTLSIFEQVLTAGPDGTVINMLVDPHFITMDLLIISTADVNKALLARAIPICMSALRRRGESNPPMVADIVKMFLQLSFDPACKTELGKHVTELFDILPRLVPTPQQLRASKQANMSAPSTFYLHDTETMMAAQMLKTTLLQDKQLPMATATTPATAAVSTSLVHGIMRRMVHTHRSTSAEFAASIPDTTPIPETPRASVIISYSWQSSDLAKRLDEYLSQQGLRVWVDYRCMDNAPGDSLDVASREAGTMIVLCSAKYKESAVCRKEIELAEERKLPIIFVQAQDNYKPDGWLALSLNMASMLVPRTAGYSTTQTMFPGWTAPILKSSVAAILRRITLVAPQCIPSKNQPTNTSRTTSRTTSTMTESVPVVAETDPRLLEAIMNLTLTMNEMRRELNELRLEVRGMKSN